MTKEKGQIKIVENPVNALRRFFDRETIGYVIGSILLGVVTHFLFFIHAIKNADCWQYASAYQSGKWEVSIGRWFLPIWDFFRGKLNVPYLTALISIVIMALVPVVIRKTLKLNRTVTAFLAITLMISPYMCIIMTYTYCCDAYAAAFLFAAIAALLLSIEEKKHRILRVLVAAIFIMLSLAIYQIYFGAVCVLLMIKVLKEVSEEPLGKKKVIQLAKEVGIYLSGVGLGLGMYYGMTNIILRIADLQRNQVYGAYGNSIMDILAEIPARALYIYERTGKYFLMNGLVNNAYSRNKMMKIFLVFFAIWVVYTIWKNRMDIKRIVIYVIGIAIIPLVAEGVLLVSPGDDLSLRLSGPLLMCMPLLLHLVRWDTGKRFHIIKLISNLVLVGYLWTSLLSVHATYTAFVEQYNQEKTYSQQIVYEIEKQEEYYRGMPVCIVGTINSEEFGKGGKISAYAYWGSPGNIYEGEEVYNAARNDWTVFMAEELGVNLNLVEKETFLQIYNSQEFKEMKLFPKEGSVKVMDGVVVVKLSEKQ